MDLTSITPLILTYNEENNLPRVLTKLAWAANVVVLDSGSTDRTVSIAESDPRVTLVHRPFDDHVSQWNFGLDQVRSPWVLSLDADYVLSDGFATELESLEEVTECCGYEAQFRYCVNGYPLRASLYPPRIVLFQRNRARYVADGHTQLLRVEGRIERLRSPILHDDRKPLQSWLRAQERYSLLERDKLLSAPPGELSFVDRLRRVGWPAPLVMPAYCLLARGLIRDGRPGWFYTMQRTYAELLLALRLFEGRLNQAVARKEHPAEADRASKQD